MRIADRCLQVLGASGVSQDTSSRWFARFEPFASMMRRPRFINGRSPAGTTPVRSGFELDRGALTRWMAAHIADFSGPLDIQQFRGGQSNPTYKLITPSRGYVLRRKPSGPLIKGAHAVEREARVLRALGPTAFPVPQVYALCTDDAVIGAWFYVMDMVEGRIFWDATVSSVSGVERAAIFDSMNQVIASLHCLDPEQVGVRDFGRQANYVERQIARWSSQYFDDPQAFIRPSRESLPCLTGSCRRWAIRSSISLGMR